MIKIGMERAEEMGISLLDVINLQHELTQTVEWIYSISLLKQSNQFTASTYPDSLTDNAVNFQSTP